MADNTDTPDEATRDTTIVTLTNDLPVEVRKAEWPLASSARLTEDGRAFTLFLRRHADGRVLVSGHAQAVGSKTLDARSGYLVQRGDSVSDAVFDVCEDLDAPANIGTKLLAQLPPRKI